MYAAAASVLGNKDITNKILLGVLILGGGYALYRYKQNADQDSAQKDLDNSPEAQQANNLLALIHPYSYKKFPLLSPGEAIDVARDYLANVDEKAIIREAGTIKNLDKVATYYYKLTGNRIKLADDLRKVLNASEQKAFYEKININKANSSTDTKPFDVYAAPTGNNKFTNTWDDAYLKKVLFGYPKGAKIGTVSKQVTVPFKDSKGVVTKMSLYYMKGLVGQIKDRYVYVLVSQVSKNKPK